MNAPTADDYAWAARCAQDGIKELHDQIELMGEFVTPRMQQKYADCVAELEAREARFREALRGCLMGGGQ